MNWPQGKDFAFTVVDDTDNATLANIGPVYRLLQQFGLKTTKTVWVYPSRDRFTGETLRDPQYLTFLLELEAAGFEIQLHNVGSGRFLREEIQAGFEEFRSCFGRYPGMHINHSDNPDNLYWGYKRFGPLVGTFMRTLQGEKGHFHGDEEQHPQFWGDLARMHVKYIRNRVFNGINTLAADPRMPYREEAKQYSNFWFSSSNGHTVQEFNDLIRRKNVHQLVREKGLCIVYTHFASGFVDEHGELEPRFAENIRYLASQNGWFAPASTILDHLLTQRAAEPAGFLYTNLLDFHWLVGRIWKKIRYGR